MAPQSPSATILSAGSTDVISLPGESLPRKRKQIRKTTEVVAPTLEHFHSVTTDRVAGSINYGLRNGWLNDQDVKLIRAFIHELKGSSHIGDTRAHKLTATLVGWRRFIGPYKDLDMPGIYDGIERLKASRNEKGLPFANNTLYDFIRILKQFCEWLMDEEIIRLPSKKFKNLQPPERSRCTKTEKDIFSVEEIEALVRACRNSRDRAIIMTFYEGGLRPGEIGLMKWSDLKFDERGIGMETDFKTGINRYIRLITAKPFLHQWRMDYPLDSENPDAPVFVSEYNSPLTHAGLAKHIRVIVKRAGIERHIVLHMFRHSRITHLAKAGVPESIIKTMMWGHVGTGMFETYTHLVKEDVDQAIMKYYDITDPRKATIISRLEPRVCPDCATICSPLARYCECGHAFTTSAVKSMQEIQNIALQNPEKLKSYIDSVVNERVDAAVNGNKRKDRLLIGI